MIKVRGSRNFLGPLLDLVRIFDLIYSPLSSPLQSRQSATFLYICQIEMYIFYMNWRLTVTFNSINFFKRDENASTIQYIKNQFQ